MVITSNLLLISTATAGALIISGIVGIRNNLSQEATETLLFFGSFILAAIASILFGFPVAAALIGIPSIGFVLYYKSLSATSSQLDVIYSVAKEFLFLGLFISCLLLFSKELRGIFNLLATNPDYFIILSAIIAGTNIILHMLDVAPTTRYYLTRVFYLFFLISVLMLAGVEALFIVVIAATGAVKAIPHIRAAIPKSQLIKFSDQYFTTLLIVALVRFFLIQPYQVPTGSLEPTVMPGDFLLVNQYAYGIRLPLNQKVIIPIGTPARGDIAVFQHPSSPEKLVKRVVGLPGDHIVYRNKQLIINGLPVAQSSTINTSQATSAKDAIIQLTEYLPGKTHQIQITPYTRGTDTVDVVIPPNHYFMMGDNRDNSGDSRIFGPVSEDLLIGKAFFVWMNWNPNTGFVDYERIGQNL